MKIEYISGSIVQDFIQFVLVAGKIEGYRNILKLSCMPLAFTSNKAFLNKKEV